MNSAGSQRARSGAPAHATGARPESSASPAPPDETRAEVASRGFSLFSQRSGLGLLPAPLRRSAVVLGSPWALGLGKSLHVGPAARTGDAAGTASAPGLPHWDKLPPGRPREFSGEVYDTNVVKRIFPDEVYSWEHQRTTAALTDLAAQDAWEQHAVPPIHLAFSEQGLSNGDRRLHFACIDGHHRLHAAMEAARLVGKPLGLPAMVTSLWECDSRGSLVGYGRMPHSLGNPLLSRAWNHSGRPLTIHVPERVIESNVWGSSQISLTLPGSSLKRSLQEVAYRLNGFKRPNEYLNSTNGSTVLVRITLQDVYGRIDEGCKNGDLKRDLRFSDVDLSAPDWRSILHDRTPLHALFNIRHTQDYPIIQIDVQQGDYFKTPGI